LCKYRLPILPVAAIFGVNVSGKSNLIDAMAMMKFHIQTSLAKDNVINKIQVEPFLLSITSRNQPTEFEISFLTEQKLFRYGFLADKDRVFEEWLYEKELKERAKEKELFYRQEDTLDYHATLFKVGKVIQEQHYKDFSLKQIEDETGIAGEMKELIRYADAGIQDLSTAGGNVSEQEN
jgi:AAA15 family ATPase/GTPase